ncbi:MAG: hypothetical protein LAN61_11335 [Acidobacteriia bacterium]|nr:hypothetical protein [Terriglobia bacterium]
MNLLLVTFALRDPNKVYDPFFVELRGNSLNWMHFIEQTCLVSSHLDEDAMTKKLIQHIEATDSLIVVKIEPHQFNGWLPQAAWDWLHSVSNQIQSERQAALPIYGLSPPPQLK